MSGGEELILPIHPIGRVADGSGDCGQQEGTCQAHIRRTKGTKHRMEKAIGIQNPMSDEEPGPLPPVLEKNRRKPIP